MAARRANSRGDRIARALASGCLLWAFLVVSAHADGYGLGPYGEGPYNGGPPDPPATTSSVDTVDVQLAVNDALSLGCDGTDANTAFDATEPVSLGSLTYSGDTGPPTYSSQDNSVWCYVKTNNPAGYTLGWHIASGSGGHFTGYLVSQFEDKIAPIGTGSGHSTAAWSVAATDARWGARVSSTSSGSVTGPYDFGTDAFSEKWARVGTGSTVAIRRSIAVSQHGSGDLIKIGFRAQIGTAITQPAGTYKVTVIFTAATL